MGDGSMIVISAYAVIMFHIVVYNGVMAMFLAVGRADHYRRFCLLRSLGRAIDPLMKGDQSM
jgi:hypothetical protein